MPLKGMGQESEDQVSGVSLECGMGERPQGIDHGFLGPGDSADASHGARQEQEQEAAVRGATRPTARFC